MKVMCIDDDWRFINGNKPIGYAVPKFGQRCTVVDENFDRSTQCSYYTLAEFPNSGYFETRAFVPVMDDDDLISCDKTLELETNG